MEIILIIVMIGAFIGLCVLLQCAKRSEQERFLNDHARWLRIDLRREGESLRDYQRRVNEENERYHA